MPEPGSSPPRRASRKASPTRWSSSAQKLADLARSARRVGIGNDYDVSVAEASLATYRDAAEQLDLAFRQSVQAIETLIGRYPAAELEVADRPA